MVVLPNTKPFIVLGVVVVVPSMVLLPFFEFVQKPLVLNGLGWIGVGEEGVGCLGGLVWLGGVSVVVVYEAFGGCECECRYDEG